MSSAVPIALIGWPFVVLVLFRVLRPRRAVVTAFLAAWLFLPVTGYELPGIPDYTKMTATCVGIFLAALAFDRARLLAFRPEWIDLPIALWCLCPLFSSISNDLGFRDGLSASLSHAFSWGLPYVIGRIYFSDLDGLRELAIGIFIGGLLYVPLCLYEIRMSPQLHSMVYGFHQHSWVQTKRFGGWRPTVFMEHGLAVGMWMAVASVVGFWLWSCGVVRKILHVPAILLVPALALTALLCKSFGSLLLLGQGTATLLATRWTRSGLFVGALLIVPGVYIVVRASGAWSGDHAVQAAGLISAERAGSIRYRFEAEDLLARHALKRPVFGWAGWGRNRPSTFNPFARRIAIDGMWIIALGQYGIVGLSALVSLVLLPPLMFWRRVPATLWAHPRYCSAAALAMILTLFMVDSLLNAMMNPVYMLAAGGLGGLLLPDRRRRTARSPVPAPSDRPHPETDDRSWTLPSP